MSKRLTEDSFLAIERRADRLDAQAGAHMEEQGDVRVLHDPQRALVLKSGPLEATGKFWRQAIVSLMVQTAGISAAKLQTLPYVKDGRIEYLSQYVDHDPRGSSSPEQAADLLVQLHAITLPKSYPLATSNLEAVAQQVVKHPECSPDLAQIIEGRCLDLVERVSADMDQYSTMVHGDLHLGNILPTQPQPTLIDFEHAGRGSPLCDLATIYHGSRRFGLDQTWADAFISAYANSSGQSLAMLPDYTDWRNWYGALSMWLRVKAGRGDEQELARRLSWVYNETDGQKWKRI